VHEALPLLNTRLSFWVPSPAGDRAVHRRLRLLAATPDHGTRSESGAVCGEILRALGC